MHGTSTPCTGLAHTPALHGGLCVDFLTTPPPTNRNPLPRRPVVCALHYTARGSLQLLCTLIGRRAEGGVVRKGHTAQQGGPWASHRCQSTRLHHLVAAAVLMTAVAAAGGARDVSVPPPPPPFRARTGDSYTHLLQGLTPSAVVWSVRHLVVTKTVIW
jgi:hypothetical protein